MLWKKSSKSLYQEKQITIYNSMGGQSIVSFKGNSWVSTKKDILTALAQEQATNKQTAIKTKAQHVQKAMECSSQAIGMWL